MYIDCLELKKVTSWLDTVDVEHVVLNISNECKEDLEVLKLTVIGDPGGDVLHEKSRIVVPAGRNYQLEVLIEKLFERLHIELEFKEEKIRFSIPIR